MPADRPQERLRIARATLAQIAPEEPREPGIGRAFGNEVLILLQIAREHDEQLLAMPRQLDEALDAVRPIGLATEMIDDDYACVLKHIVDIEIDRCRLPQIGHIGESQARKAGADPLDHARKQ